MKTPSFSWYIRLHVLNRSSNFTTMYALKSQQSDKKITSKSNRLEVIYLSIVLYRLENKIAAFAHHFVILHQPRLQW